MRAARSHLRNLVASLIVVSLFFMVCVMNSVPKYATIGAGESLLVSNNNKPAIVHGHDVVGGANNTRLLAADDFSTLINLTRFQFRINSRRCQGSPVYLVVFVHSRPSNFHKRQVIRRTWGNESLFDGLARQMRLVFMLGSVANDTGGSSSTQTAIEAESHRYGDIVQGNFDDTYRNLTYKHVMGLKWVAYFCPQTNYVLKTDDDIFVDIFQLMFYLRRYEQWPTGQLMACYVITNPYPKRSQRSKWRVSWQEYPHKYYPHYCSGWGILMTPDVAFKLYALSRSLPYFWVDDVHISGLLAQKIGIEHTDFNLQLAIGEEEVTEFLEGKRLALPPLFGLPDSSTDAIERLWNKTLRYYRTKYGSNSIANI